MYFDEKVRLSKKRCFFHYGAFGRSFSSLLNFLQTLEPLPRRGLSCENDRRSRVFLMKKHLLFC